MKKLLILVLLPMSAHAGFTCDGRRLITDEGEAYNFSSERECSAAVSSAKNGFVCDGRKMVLRSGKTYTFPTESACNSAVSGSN